MIDSVIQLKCSCNNYPWGKVGKDSLAARFCSQTPNTDFKIDNGTEYAEMWMGTYPDTPSYVLSTGDLLQDVLNANKDMLIGKPVLSRHGTDLPFLPKILSIAKALPLQIHPDKDLAARLHEKNPDKFTDANHKPEIAVALSKFEVFIGFKPQNFIRDLMKLEPLKQFLPSGTSNLHFNNDTIRDICASILKASPETTAKVQKGLSEVPKSMYDTQGYILELLPRLQSQYGETDSGNLVALLFMNFLVLQPGQAIYVPANGMHAYLSGDIVECMARSNNVLNTGFCPRADRDSVDLFTAALTFQQYDPDEPILKKERSGKSRNGKTGEFKPPMSEFNMLVTELQGGEKDIVAKAEGPSIMIVTHGRGSMKVGGKEYGLKEGWIYFVGCGVDVEFEAANGGKGLEVYRAYVE